MHHKPFSHFNLKRSSNILVLIYSVNNLKTNTFKHWGLKCMSQQIKRCRSVLTLISSCLSDRDPLFTRHCLIKALLKVFTWSEPDSFMKLLVKECGVERSFVCAGGAGCPAEKPLRPHLFAPDCVHFAPCIQTSHKQANNHVCRQTPVCLLSPLNARLLSFRWVSQMKCCRCQSVLLTPWELAWSLGEWRAAGQINARAFVSCSNSFCLPEVKVNLLLGHVRFCLCKIRDFSQTLWCSAFHLSLSKKAALVTRLL